MARPHLEKYPCTSDGRPNGYHVDVAPILYFMTSWGLLEEIGKKLPETNASRKSILNLNSGHRYNTIWKNIRQHSAVFRYNCF